MKTLLFIISVIAMIAAVACVITGVALVDYKITQLGFVSASLAALFYIIADKIPKESSQRKFKRPFRERIVEFMLFIPVAGCFIYLLWT